MGNVKQTAESKIFLDIYPNGFSPYRIKWFDLAFASIITLIVLILYILTLAPSVIAGDSGELTTEIYQMGACRPAWISFIWNSRQAIYFPARRRYRLQG